MPPLQKGYIHSADEVVEEEYTWRRRRKRQRSRHPRYVFRRVQLQLQFGSTALLLLDPASYGGENVVPVFVGGKHLDLSPTNSLRNACSTPGA